MPGLPWEAEAPEQLPLAGLVCELLEPYPRMRGLRPPIRADEVAQINLIYV